VSVRAGLPAFTGSVAAERLSVAYEENQTAARSVASGPAERPAIAATLRTPDVTSAWADTGLARDRGVVSSEARPLPRELEPPVGESIHAQIVRSMRLQWTGGVGEARVTLRPEYLGDVVASITVDRGIVTATLHADTPEVRRWLESHSASLRDALVEHGLQLDRLAVMEPEREAAAGDRQGRSRGRPQDPPARQGRRRPNGEAAATFDLTTE
jgi:flagellar hook-length control protein FliK